MDVVYDKSVEEICTKYTIKNEQEFWRRYFKANKGNVSVLTTLIQSSKLNRVELARYCVEELKADNIHEAVIQSAIWGSMDVFEYLLGLKHARLPEESFELAYLFFHKRILDYYMDNDYMPDPSKILKNVFKRC